MTALYHLLQVLILKKLQERTSVELNYSIVEATISIINVALYENDIDFWIGSYEIGDFRRTKQLPTSGARSCWLCIDDDGDNVRHEQRMLCSLLMNSKDYLIRHIVMGGVHPKFRECLRKEGWCRMKGDGVRTKTKEGGVRSKGGDVQGVTAITIRREVCWTIMILNRKTDDQALALFESYLAPLGLRDAVLQSESIFIALINRQWAETALLSRGMVANYTDGLDVAKNDSNWRATPATAIPRKYIDGA